MKLYDCFIFNNELDILEVRLKYLWDVVDTFVLVESDTTFSGKEKPLHFEKNKERFKWAKSKIKHVVQRVDRSQINYKNESAEASLEHKTFRWELEKSQRNYLKEGLSDASKEDLIIMNDVDEIPRKDEILKIKKEGFENEHRPLTFFNLLCHYYYANCQGSGDKNRWFVCSAIFRKKMLWQDMLTMQEIRDLRWSVKCVKNGGWHFSYLGDVKSIKDKIASISHTEYDTPEYKNEKRIKEAIEQGNDLFGREGHKFKYVNILNCSDYDDDLKKVLKEFKHLTNDAAGAKATKVCLNMIVKDESEIIERCLESVAPHVDCYVICDTGSSDDTKEKIKKTMDKHGVSGEIHDIEFKNFGYARNRALELAKQSELSFDYILFDDADMELEVLNNNWRENLSANFYIVRQYNTISYHNVRLIKRDIKSKYIGVTHEYVECEGKKERLDSIQYIDHACGSSRKEKFIRDARLLEDGLKEEGEGSSLWGRYLFYLGQTYYDMSNFREAIKWYKKRIEAGGWHEELFYSMHRIGLAYKALNEEENMIKAFLDAYNLHPGRIETIYELARFYREKDQFHSGYMFAKMGSLTPYPENDVLFIAKDVYDFKIWDELGVCSFWVGSYKESFDICDKLLKMDIPEDYKSRIKENREFAREKLWKTTREK